MVEEDLKMEGRRRLVDGGRGILARRYKMVLVLK